MELFTNKASIRTITTLLAVAGTATFISCTDSEGNAKKENNTMKTENLKTKKKKGFKTNIEKSTLENQNFRKVLYTADNLQLVLMSLNPKEDIGEETHPDTDQFFRFESGHGKVMINGTEYEVKDGDAVVIPAGSKHNVINTDGSKELKLYTIYSPPIHKDAVVRKTKEDAETNEEEFDGVTSEGKK